MNYNELDKLNELRNKGAITEEEYQREKNRILNQHGTASRNMENEFWGTNNRTYAMIMHIAQLFPGPGWILSIIMWAINRDNDNYIDENGKIIINWLISSVIYTIIFAILIVIVIGIPLLVIWGICNLIFVIIGAVKAYNGELWPYPLSFKLV